MSDPFSWEFWAKDPDSVRNLAFTVGALLAATLGTVLALWRTIAANRSSRAAARQAETGVQSHITQNFTKAVEQLGSDKLDVRLGGIYALARIAQDSSRDYWPIMQTLTAYVRERRPRRPDTQSSETEKSLMIVDTRGAPFSVPLDTHIKSLLRRIETAPPELPVDIQSVLAVLGSRKHEYEKPYQVLDLSNTGLGRLDLRQGENHLAPIDLSLADLREASLGGANLIESSLFYADLRGANLREAVLREAVLRRANLRGANLRGGDLSEADLSEADLYRTTLTGAKNLTCEQLTRARNWESAFRDSTLACGADIPQE